jgi:RNase P/RNase MRP subunit p30
MQACNNIPFNIATSKGELAHSTDLVAALSARSSARVTRNTRKSMKRSRKEMEAPRAAAATAVGPLVSGDGSSIPMGPRNEFVQLSRITVDVGTFRNAHEIHPANAVLNSYDIVAVTPGEADVAKHAIQSGIVDIISLDVSAGKLPFFLTKELVSLAVDNNVVFELDYAAAIRDPSCRRFFVGNCLSLLKYTRGKHLIFSSGAQHVLELRSPRDAAAIATLAGLSLDQAYDAMSSGVATILCWCITSFRSQFL